MAPAKHPAVIEKAEAPCAICGAPLDDQGYCRSDSCPSNRDTIRPRPSHPHPIRQPRPSGTFSVRESQRTTYNELLSSPAPPEIGPTADAIPTGPRLPDFSAEELDDSDRYDPPTRRDLPLWQGPPPPPKPKKK